MEKASQVSPGLTHQKMNKGFIFFFTETTEGRNVYRINFALDKLWFFKVPPQEERGRSCGHRPHKQIKVTVACNYFNQLVHLTTGVMKKSAFGF